MNVRRFRPQNAMRRKLPFPATPTLRVAQVAGATFSASAEVFPLERWNELEAFQPRALAGPAADLQRLAERVQMHTLDLSGVDHAIFVLTECGDKPLTDVLRVVLWQTFGVPVYELLIGTGGVLLASECEVHEGWHAESPAAFSLIDGELVVEMPGRNAVRTSWTAYLEEEPCSCGRPGVRIMDVDTGCIGGAPRELAATA